MKTKITIITLASTLTLVGCSSQKTTESTMANDTTSQEVDVEEVMTGAYSEERELSSEEQALFKSTYKGEVELTPCSVSAQVVAGMNYAFTCKDKDGNRYKVVIYKPLPGQGEPEVTSVEKK